MGHDNIDESPSTVFSQSVPSVGRRRSILPRKLICVALPVELSSRVRLLVPEVQMECVSSLTQATEAVQRSLDACLLLSVPGDHEGHSEPYARFRRRFPHLPVAALFVSGVSAHREALTLGRIGISDILSADTDLKPNTLRTALERCQAQGISHRIWYECRLNLPDPLVTLLKTALRFALSPLSVVTLAEEAGMPARSLRLYCEIHRIPSPQVIIGWARLLTAAHYLDEPGRTIAQVAELLKYPSSCALRNQLRRYVSGSPRALRREGIMQRLCQSLETNVAAASQRAT